MDDTEFNSLSSKNGEANNLSLSFAANSEFNDTSGSKGLLKKIVTGAAITIVSVTMILTSVNQSEPDVNEASITSESLVVSYSFTLVYMKACSLYVSVDEQEDSYTCPWDDSVPTVDGKKSLEFKGSFKNVKGYYSLSISSEFGYGKSTIYTSNGISE